MLGQNGWAIDRAEEWEMSQSFCTPPFLIFWMHQADLGYTSQFIAILLLTLVYPVGLALPPILKYTGVSPRDEGNNFQWRRRVEAYEMCGSLFELVYCFN